MKKIALDVDGVLADFYLAMCQRFNMPYKMIDSWESDWIEDNFSKILDDELFWATLPQIMSPESITFPIECYMTALPAPMKKAREYWLSKLGYPKAPVIVSYDKFLACKELEIDILIDDKPKTVKEFLDHKHHDLSSPTAIQFLPPYTKDEMIVKNAITIRHLDEVNLYL